VGAAYVYNSPACDYVVVSGNTPACAAGMAGERGEERQWLYYILHVLCVFSREANGGSSSRLSTVI
jgi:hypothetical protein